ncbi:MAG: NAD(P)/FAD-dependent oxidoreductase [Planctomycetota bacterium]|nr:MAG: NAD(P)/FAD-dependent oxidoreductase [Planctomycetota bacterium]REJ98565.1 MAG: NAD(P)/FAD-dependent oxidoreductase [Planctomycetota bacterium]REK29865.1 MAG: NAD(P)/FAD-dependent oxidoreductase [Planctomycetota bacterium]REK47964.1 MAG: NAD(P)/FAD-dependent oxidoreductase [Planctomycetota bacterium]
MYDTVIIGAGMSGLAAGIRLAHYDQRVCILERHYTIGGLNSFYRLGGRDYDVGLHAVTNYSAKGTRKGPLARILKQLRFRWEEFSLSEQIGSAIAFPGVKLSFTNDVRFLEAEVERCFPSEVDNFRGLLTKIADYDELDDETFDLSTRQVLGEIFTEPLLIEMLLCPTMWYGNARERDMDWGQFCIMFRSIFLEGFARPLAGVRLILKKLIKRFRSLGGELKLRAGVQQIRVEDDRAVGVVLDSGEQIEAKQVVSSAGFVETMRLCDDITEPDVTAAGQLSFAESICTLDCQPRDLGYQETIVFFNDTASFHWETPAELCDLRTGVICSPNNFAYGEAQEALPEGTIRVSLLANFRRWNELSEEDYPLEKLRWLDRCLESAVRFCPDFRSRVVATDMFTPKTIRRFTWHDNGAVYGAPKKRLDGATHLRNLFLCGSDQGFVGIIGAMVSGISIANRLLVGGVPEPTVS